MPLRSRLRDLKVKYSKGRAYQDSLPVSGSLAHSPGETLQTPLPDIEASACSIDTGLRHAGSSKASSSGPGALPDAKLLTLDLGASKTILQGRNFVTTSGDLWDRAYKQLKDKNEHLVLQYESLLAENLRTSHASHSLAKTSILPELGLGQPAEIHVSTSSNFLAPLGSPQRQHQMKALLEEKIKDDEDAILKFNIGSTQVIVRDQLDKVVKVVAAAKDFVGASVASEPHAALAWTGVCTLLPLLLIPSEQRAANATGLAEIADMIQYYNVVEVLYREAFKDEISSQIQADFEAKLVDLYCLILEYQAQTIRQLSTNILIKSYGKTKSSWVRILDSIKESDILCKQRLDLLDRNRLRQTLETQESRINEQYSELFQRLINLQESGNETLRILRDQIEIQRREKLELWLRRINQRDIQAARQRKREPKTGQWLLEGQVFRDWFHGITPLLWIHGGVGCGKSILCSSLVEKLQQTEKSPCTLAYFYSSWDSAASHDLGIILSCVLSQFALDPRFVPRLEALKKESEKRTLDSIDLSKALITTLAEISSNGTLDARERDQEIAPIVIILDALDEIPFGFQRDAMIEFLNDLAAAHLGCLRVLITSRRDIDIEERLASKGIYKSQEISTDHVKQDVGIFVEGQIARHPRLKLQSARVKKMISNGVVDIAGGMFQLASLQMEELEDKNQQTLRPIDVERTLGSLPHGLEESYNRIIQRIQIQDQLLEECLVALKWLVFSKEPLLIEELVDACVLTPSSKSTWDPERRLNPVDLLNNLVGLVAVRTSYGRRIVSLAHLSVREYLLPQQRKRAPQLEVLSDFDFHSTHKFIAQSCLTYLVHCALAKDNNFYGYDNMMDGYALRNYAWHWWASHAAASVYSNDSRATRLAMRLFNSLAFRMLYQDDNESAETDRTLKDLTGHFRSLEVTALRRVLANPRFSSGPRSSKSLFVLPPYINHLHDEVWDYAVGPYPMLRTLPDDQQALRLFILHPPRDGAPFDLLEGSLCMEFLENGSLYTALSYTTHLTIPALLPEEFDQQSSQQGLQPRDSMIRIHGADLSVTPSLLGALLTLRHPTRDRVLWLDTLCLSRHPPFERSALVQTQRMFDIYCNAKEVALWLGSESSSSKEVMLLLGAASDEPTKVVDALATKSVTESIAARPNAHDLDEFFSRSIWWRLWVIQEIIGGAHVKLYCGRLSLDYDTMKTVDEIYHDQDSQHSPHFGETQRSAHSTRGISPRSNAAWLQRLRREYLSGKRAELTELLHLTCNYSCYLPEDRVIALLALLPDTDAADLATLLGESSTWVGKLPYVYGAATQHIITKSQGLDILAYAPGPELRISTFALPSWIPNWEKLDPPILETRLYNACNGHPESPSFSFPHEKKFFAINGVVVGHISRLENVFQPSLLHESSQSLSPSKKLEPVRQAPEGQTQAEMYWRTVSTDLWVAEGKAPRRIGKEGGSMAGWKQLVSQHRRDDNGAQRVIYTENGFLGSTYCSAQEEDLVILLPGGRTPFVVRRTDTYESRLHFPGEPIPSAVRSLESKSLDCITCRLIGQSYMHGIMDGEFFHNPDDNVARASKRFVIV